jgi:hypothetical protein
MMADWLITTNKFSITTTRKILNSIGQFGPAICLALVSYTGCNRALTVFLLTVGIGLNGAIYSGFKVSNKLYFVLSSPPDERVINMRTIYFTD